jgi:hypothetical protein
LAIGSTAYDGKAWREPLRDGTVCTGDETRWRHEFQRVGEGDRCMPHHDDVDTAIARVGRIARFTPYGASRGRKVFGFFLAERMNLSIYVVVPTLDLHDREPAISLGGKGLGRHPSSLKIRSSSVPAG